MKKLSKMFVSSLILLSFSSCSSSVNTTDVINNQNVNIQTNQTKEDIYPFELNEDFFPLYNATQWKYDIFDTKTNKLVTTLTKTLDASNESSLEHDKKNNYYLIGLKKSYSTDVKDTEAFEFIRRRANQLAFGKIDDLTYYPDKQKDNISKTYNPYDFRAFSDFSSSKLETVKVKAGTFQCIKSEFTLKLDKYTIWYAKGIGEVKRIKQGYFNGFRFELSEYNNTAKQFVLSKQTISLRDLSTDIQAKANAVKDQFLKLNGLPNDIFLLKSSSTILIENRVLKDNYKKTYQIHYVNKSLASKENVTLVVYMSFDGSVKHIIVAGEENAKPIYQGKIVDKLPLINK